MYAMKFQIKTYSHILLFARETSVRLGVFINHSGDTVVRLLLFRISAPSDEFGGISISSAFSLVLNEMFIVMMCSS